MDAFERFGRELLEAGGRRRRARERAHRRRAVRQRLIWTGFAVIVVAALSASVGLLAPSGPEATASAQADRLLASARASAANAPVCRPPVPGRPVFVPIGIPPPQTAALLEALQRPQTHQELKLSETFADLRLAGPAAQLLGASLRTLGTPTGSSATLVLLRRLPPGVTHSEPVLCVRLELLEARRLGRHEAVVSARVQSILRAGLAEDERLTLRYRSEEVYVRFFDQRHLSGALRESVGRFAQRGAITAYQLAGPAAKQARIEGVLPDRVASVELMLGRAHKAPSGLSVDKNLIAATISATRGSPVVLTLLDAQGRELARERVAVR